MPKKGFKSISITEETYRKLIEIRDRRGFATLSDTITYLVTVEQLILTKLEEVTTSRGTVTATTGTVTTGSGTITTSSGTITTSSGKRKERKRAIDILRKQKIIFEDEVRGKIRNIDAFFGRLERDGAEIILTEKGRIAVDPEYWVEFKTEKLPNIPYHEEEARKKLSEKDYKLFETLKHEGLIYFDHQEKQWIFA